MDRRLGFFQVILVHTLASWNYIDCLAIRTLVRQGSIILPTTQSDRSVVVHWAAVIFVLDILAGLRILMKAEIAVPMFFRYLAGDEVGAAVWACFAIVVKMRRIDL